VGKTIGADAPMKAKSGREHSVRGGLGRMPGSKQKPKNPYFPQSALYAALCWRICFAVAAVSERE
jgi:hypothetical protein